MRTVTKTRDSGVELPARSGANGEQHFALPATAAARHRLRHRLDSFLRGRELVPPLLLDELRELARAFIRRWPEYEPYGDTLAVLANNAVWQPTVASIPYERRVLLLPQCLRAVPGCKAEMDDFGLLCAECGACPIGAIQAEAESLGYIVLVAEGTTVVTRLLEGGTVDAVIGVSCLASLKKMFSRMANEAIPGLAVPLVFDGCVRTQVEIDWVLEAVRACAGAGHFFGASRLGALQERVRAWFTPTGLQEVMGPAATRVQALARDWLLADGKRWRPLLTAACYATLAELEAEERIPPAVRALAVGVECFHKASLIHDDIEDHDETRYGRQTLHRRHGLETAINLGDLLMGEGYRLIAGCGLAPERVGRMLRAAAAAHCSLCAGQGEELLWRRSGDIPDLERVLEVYRRKTSPAFRVALELGAMAGGAGEEYDGLLHAFSEHFGIAFQIRDDLDDFLAAATGRASGDEYRFSLLPALALEATHSHAAARERLQACWRQEAFPRLAAGLMDELGVEEKARQLCEHHRHKAVRALIPIKNAALKSLLRRLAGRIICRERACAANG